MEFDNSKKMEYITYGKYSLGEKENNREKIDNNLLVDTSEKMFFLTRNYGARMYAAISIYLALALVLLYKAVKIFGKLSANNVKAHSETVDEIYADLMMYKKYVKELQEQARLLKKEAPADEEMEEEVKEAYKQARDYMTIYYDYAAAELGKVSEAMKEKI